MFSKGFPSFPTSKLEASSTPPPPCSVATRISFSSPTWPSATTYNHRTVMRFMKRRGQDQPRRQPPPPTGATETAPLATHDISRSRRLPSYAFAWPQAKRGLTYSSSPLPPSLASIAFRNGEERGILGGILCIRRGEGAIR